MEGLADRFPWPLNAPRHCWITVALERGLPLREIEPFLGHVPVPNPWGLYSLRSTAVMAQSFRELGTAIVKEAGFRDLAW